MLLKKLTKCIARSIHEDFRSQFHSEDDKPPVWKDLSNTEKEYNLRIARIAINTIYSNNYKIVEPSCVVGPFTIFDKNGNGVIVKADAIFSGVDKIVIGNPQENKIVLGYRIGNQ